jgi:hypothetical protein
VLDATIRWRKACVFDLTVVSVREASAEEIEERNRAAEEAEAEGEGEEKRKRVRREGAEPAPAAAGSRRGAVRPTPVPGRPGRRP